ncbi:MAG: glycosyltransferase [Pseudomonadota bacterium]
MSAEQTRILIYSHDTFGLGHLRRCRAIAHALAEGNSTNSILILSGSPIIGSFDFRAQVDFVRVPGVIKLRNGDYTSLGLHIDIEHTLELRAEIIEHTARTFRPDIFIVDKEPLGLRGEVGQTLDMLHGFGTRNILGLRDVLDAPDVLVEEWDRKQAYSAIESLYDDVWIYGLNSIYDPLTALPLSDNARNKVTYTGYLRRFLPRQEVFEPSAYNEDEPFILVTPGGGGDGIELVDWVMRAYETQLSPLFPALIALGPFMAAEQRRHFFERAERLRNVRVIRFTPDIEALMDQATAVVGMGGYNTFCEVLSFDKPALLVPRIVPRREQAIRADRAEAAGLIKQLPIDHYPNVELMTNALAELPLQPKPSEAGITHLLDGLDVINAKVRSIVGSSKTTLRAANE